MEEQKTYEQLKEEASKLSSLCIEKIREMPQVLADRISDKQSEIWIKRINRHPLENDMSLILAQNHDKVFAIVCDYGESFGRQRFEARQGIVPDRKYRRLWKKLESNDIWHKTGDSDWELEGTTSVVRVKKSERTNGFYINEYGPLDFINFFGKNKITRKIWGFRKYAISPMNIDDLVDDCLGVKQAYKDKRKEIEQHLRCQAQEFRNQMRYDESIGLYKKLIKENPHNYDAYYYISEIFSENGKKAEALEKLKSLIEIAGYVSDRDFGQAPWVEKANKKIKELETS